jgi:hypothetical protein
MHSECDKRAPCAVVTWADSDTPSILSASRGLYNQPADTKMPLSADVKVQVNLLHY